MRREWTQYYETKELAEQAIKTNTAWEPAEETYVRQPPTLCDMTDGSKKWEVKYETYRG